jgi:tripartite-type tricarboxylate transporter receptor subunit TctC
MLGLALVAMAPAVVTAQAALAAAFPEKPVTLVVTWPAGGGTDVSGRAVAKYMEGPLGQPIVVVNKPGGGGVVGTLEVERARPDGYTLVVCTSTTINTQYVGNVHNDIKKLTPIGLYGFDAGALTVRAESPWKSLKEFVAHAKANPGKLRNANDPPGGFSHIAVTGLEKAAGIKITQVPYGGFAPSVAALLGGHVESTTVPVPDVAKHHQEGKLRVLGVMAEKRHFLIPQVPILKEEGIDLSFGIWRAYCVPAGTPPDVVATLERAFLKATEHPEFKGFMEKSGWFVAPMGSKQTAGFFETEDRRIHAMLKEIGLTTK